MSGGKCASSTIMDFGNARIVTNPYQGDNWFDGRVIDV
jgi:hypothetical protein